MTTQHVRPLGLAILVVSALVVTPIHAQDRATRYKNLKVLSPDISRDQLSAIMLENLRGLGLPRLEGRGCLFCHVGSLDQSRSEWNYASDDKLTKRKARTMLQMVAAINGDHLARLEDRIAPNLRVTCNTCHAGRTDPRPLEEVLLATYTASGIDSTIARYRSLRARYFGGDAYDFRIGVLDGLATRLADDKAIDNAITIAALNAEVNPDDVRATRAWVQLRLERTIDAEGVASALGQLESITKELPPGVWTPELLDGLGWRLRRSDRAEAGNALIRANLTRFPKEYTANESMAFILHDAGKREEAYGILERWLRQHPDHDRARRLLTNLRSRR